MIVQRHLQRHARVSGLVCDHWGDADFAAFSQQVHGGYAKLDSDLRDLFESKWGPDTFVVTGKIGRPDLSSTKAFAPDGYIYLRSFNPSKKAAIPAAQLPAYLSDLAFFDAWELQYGKWVTWWADKIGALAYVCSDAEYAQTEAFRQELTDWQKRAESQAGLKSIAIDKPKDAPTGGGGGSLSDASQLLKNVVLLVGLGFGFYILTSVMAPLLSGAAKTKEEYKRLRA
jgi:hypothetical protein